MRFIQKHHSPDFFEHEKQSIPLNQDATWGALQNPCKNQLKEHLLQEQDQLCIYCECDLSATTSHLEHLIPQEKAPERRFDYYNLAVSCDGKTAQKQQGESCGHRKSNEHDETKFLNPVEEQDIGAHFQFDANTGEMQATNQQPQAAEYMIDTLNLNAPYLLNARLNAKRILVEKLSEITNEQQFELILNDELSQPREFISFLQGWLRAAI